MDFIKKFVDIKLLKFLVVGIINTIVGTGLMFGLYNLFGASYWVSTSVSYILASILSFFLNKYFTFQSKEKSWRQIFRFIINIGVCYGLAYGLAKPAVSYILMDYGTSIQENIAMLTGMCLFTGFNYIGQRFFAFKE